MLLSLFKKREKKKKTFRMERKKSKYIGDNTLLYIENPEETTSITTNKRLAERR